ncbi:MAG TPA: lyase [Acidimicrobiia bacterium]|nr:lyase [Acidimicrobiia bacterium]
MVDRRAFVAVSVLMLLASCETPTRSPATEPVGDSTTTTAPTTATSRAATPTTSITATTISTTTTLTGPRQVLGYQVFEVPAGSRPHDVAPAGDGTVWYTAQRTGRVGLLDPRTGEVTEVEVGQRSAPHGVIVGPDGAAWVTDGGLDAIVRVDRVTFDVDIHPVGRSGARLNTATFDHDGVLWFTGQAGVYGRFDPRTSQAEVFDAPGGSGPYGIATSPDGAVWYASLAGSHIARIDPSSGEAERVDPPTTDQGSRRVWSDSKGVIWVAQWNAGQLGRFDPASGVWDEWRLPGDAPQAYAVYVDETDTVWLSDFGGDHALVRFDPGSRSFDRFPLPVPGGAVRQLLGVPGEVWGALSAADALVVLRYEH